MADLTCEHLVAPGVFCGNPATTLVGEEWLVDLLSDPHPANRCPDCGAAL